MAAQRNRDAPGWIPEVQGVRTLALALIAIYHIWFGKVSGGVDVFLFISAFLLTRSLISTVERERPLRPLATILRRFARLLPLSLVSIVLIALASTVWLSISELPSTLKHSFASATYWENIYLQLESIDYFNADRTAASPFQHYWSLSIQGQMFVALPLLFAALHGLAKLTRLPTRAVAFGAFLLIAAVGFAYSVRQTELDQQRAYFDTIARLWEFAAGSLLALALPWLRVPGPVKAAFGWLGIAGLVLCGWVLPVAASFPGLAALWPITAATMLVLSAGAPNYGAGSVLNHPWLQHAARYSFALYLTHWPVLVITVYAIRRPSLNFIEGAVVLAVSIALAVLLTELVEAPVARFLAAAPAGRGLGPLARAAVVVVTAPALTLGLIGAAQLAVTAQMDAARAEAAALPAAEFGAAAPSHEEARAQPHEIVVRDDLPRLESCSADTLAALDPALAPYCAGDIAAHTWVVGNSHTQQLLPLFDGDALFALTMFSCQYGGEGVEHRFRARCEEFWREATEAVLEARPARVVILASRSYADDVEAELPGLAEWIADARAAGIEVLAVRDTPRTLRNPFLCAEQYGSDAERCAFDTSLAQPNEELETLVTGAGGEYLDINPLICPEGHCTPVRGGVYVFMDPSHVTATYMRTVAAALSKSPT